MRHLVLALGLAGAIALVAPAMAGPVTVGATRFDEVRREISVETFGAPRYALKRLINPDRLVIDFYDAALMAGVPANVPLPSARLRRVQAMQLSASPAIVRVVVELAPGYDPLPIPRIERDRLVIAMSEPPNSHGEQELETLPPTAGSLAARPVVPVPMPAPTPMPTPRPQPSAWQPAAKATPRPFVPYIPTPAPVLRGTPRPTYYYGAPTPSPSPNADDVAGTSVGRVGFGSTVLLRWQQVEALDDYAAPTGPIFGYPTGLDGIELRHWFSTYLGLGFDSRVLTYDLMAEGVRENRTDVEILPQVVGRWPLLGGWLEPEVSVGYLAHNVNVAVQNPGTSYAFSPTIFSSGPALGGGVRVRLLPALSLGLQVQLLPWVNGSVASGFASVFPLNASRTSVTMAYDVGDLFYTVGYTDETGKNTGVNFSQVITGIQVGAGWRY